MIPKMATRNRSNSTINYLGNIFKLEAYKIFVWWNSVDADYLVQIYRLENPAYIAAQRQLHPLSSAHSSYHLEGLTYTGLVSMPEK